MPSMNSIRLAADQAVTFNSMVIQLQGVREEAVTFWVWVENPTGASVLIKGSPDAEAAALTAINGATLHQIITSGTAAAGQTKINGGGHAVVTVQAHPLMYIRWFGGDGSDRLWCWLIE